MRVSVRWDRGLWPARGTWAGFVGRCARLDCPAGKGWGGGHEEWGDPKSGRDPEPTARPSTAWTGMLPWTSTQSPGQRTSSSGHTC